MKHLKGLERQFVEVDGNKITFTVQDGVVPENGVNGIQAMDMINVLADLFTSLNEEFPCAENNDTIYYLKRAHIMQQKRTKDREVKEVEGKYEN